VTDKQHNVLPVNVAPSVLPYSGGYGSASEVNVNIGFPLKFPFGDDGAPDFHIYIGRAFTEVSGVDTGEGDERKPFKTTVRSILDDVRINDVLAIGHSEAILTSTHGKAEREGQIVVGDSDLFGLRVAGKEVHLSKRNLARLAPTFAGLQGQLKSQPTPPVPAEVGKGGVSDSLSNDLFDWDDSDAVPDDPDFQYARDMARLNRSINKQMERSARFSLFAAVDAPGLKTYRSSIVVENFGRIFLGEVIVSHGTKEVTMFRIDLGCDNCGDVGGSGGSTNGGPVP
jgi:hypothetical protein